MARVKPVTAALVVSYWTALRLAITALLEAMLTMLPLPLWRRKGIAALAQNA